MKVVRFGEAPAYTALGHHDMTAVRLKGREVAPRPTSGSAFR
ncbi:hypothetical protein [Bradyrhizobium sp. C9]|nr:hypothetical protein [Bradyrhizobium sp. C9]